MEYNLIYTHFFSLSLLLPSFGSALMCVWHVVRTNMSCPRDFFFLVDDNVNVCGIYTDLNLLHLAFSASLSVMALNK